MTVDPNNTKTRDGDDRAWSVPSEARETFERVSSLQLEELLKTANGDEARGRAGRDGNGFAMPEDSDADENSSDESEVSDAGDEREDLEDVDDVERGAQRHRVALEHARLVREQLLLLDGLVRGVLEDGRACVC